MASFNEFFSGLAKIAGFAVTSKTQPKLERPFFHDENGNKWPVFTGGECEENESLCWTHDKFGFRKVKPTLAIMMYKRTRDINTNDDILTTLIYPPGSELHYEGGHAYRGSRALVVKHDTPGGSEINQTRSIYDRSFVYTAGAYVTPRDEFYGIKKALQDKFNNHYYESGIYAFTTKKKVMKTMCKTERTDFKNNGKDE